MSQSPNNTPRASPQRPVFAPVHHDHQGGRPEFVIGDNGPRVVRAIDNVFPRAANGPGSYPGNHEVRLLQD